MVEIFPLPLQSALRGPRASAIDARTAASVLPADAAKAKHAAEEQTFANIASGKHDTSWIDTRLKALGVIK
jgi:hypothetical protein